LTGIVRGESTDTTFLAGREPELRVVGNLLNAASVGNGGSVLLHGEPGIGKTALLAHVEGGATDFRIVRASGVEAESDLAFGGLRDLLHGSLGFLPTLSNVHADALAAAFSDGTTAEVGRLLVYGAALELLTVAAAQGPIMMVVDDLPWLDSPSREAVLFVARRLARLPIACLLASRTGDEAGRTSVERLALHGLGVSATAALLRRHGRDPSAFVVRDLHAATGGNPLALVELASQLHADQLSGKAALPEELPLGFRITEAFAARLVELPVQCREALTVAALSYDDRADLVAAALATVSLGLEALAAAEEVGLLSVTEGRLRWSHPLLRSAVRSKMTGPTRRRAHGAFARAAATLGLADQSIWHAAAAAIGHDPALADALEEVAERARRRGGLSASARALEASARLSSDREERVRRLLSAAQVAVDVGQSSRALALLDELGAVCEPDDPRRALEARLRARVEMMTAAPRVARDRLLGVADHWREREPGLAVGLMCEAAVAEIAGGDNGSYLRLARDALKLARSHAPDSEALPAVLVGLGLMGAGDTSEGMALLERHAAVLEQPELWSAAPEIVGTVALAEACVERFEDAQRRLVAVVDHARQTGALRALAFPLAVQADVHFRSGRWAHALDCAVEAVQLAEDVGEGALLASNLAYLARIEGAIGREQECRLHAGAALEIIVAHSLHGIAPYPRHALGLLELGLGAPDRAVTQLELIKSDVGEPGLALWQGDLGLAVIQSGDLARGRRILSELEMTAARTGRHHAHAIVCRLRGMLAAASQFDQPFAVALQAHGRAGLPFEQARTELLYGERLRRARRRTDARAWLQRSLETFTALGAAPWQQRALEEFEAAGGQAMPQARVAKWSSLTPQEGRVVDAILAGASYRAAAEQLVLSPRTVESHLRQAYRKLGVSSRGELAALASQPVDAA
jgi:DNA-binding CsgD family transcriptional regulator